MKLSAIFVALSLLVFCHASHAGDKLVIDDQSPTDCLDEIEVGGWFGSVEATFFKFNRADGVRVDDDADENASSDQEFTPRYTLGYETRPGRGFRARFWGDFDQTALPVDPAILAQGNRLTAEASTLDFEVFETKSFSQFELEWIAGLRYAKFFEAIFDDRQPAPETYKDMEGWGPTIGAEFRRNLSNHTRLFANGRYSLIFGDADVFENNQGIRRLADSNASITEIGLGLEHDLRLGGSLITVRGGYEWQRWGNFSYAFEDPHVLDFMGPPADAGFNGITLSVGITGANGPSPPLEGPPMSVGGFFGTMEATFFSLNRSDGLRMDPFPIVTADAAQEFTPRYTMGYEINPGSGVRARFWGDFEQVAHAEHPLVKAFGSELMAEASTFDFEYFETLSDQQRELELSAGIRRADYFESILDEAQPIFDSTKSMRGWGPVVGMELRRNLTKHNQVYARGRHSIIVGDARITHDLEGARDLIDTTAGITEVGFGLEHQRCIGGTQVILRGGYEWQQWRNFSYAFANSTFPFDDHMGAPADAGFHGATVSVGIARKTPGLDDTAFFCDTDEPGGLFGSVEATFFEFSRADGLRVDDDADENASGDSEFAPRYTVGYQTGSGSGIRARYWGDWEQTLLPDNPAILIQGNKLVANAKTFDLEVFDSFSFNCLDIELSTGIRYADYFEAIYDDQLPLTESTKSVDGWGPIIGAEIQKDLTRNTSLYAKGHHALIVGDSIVTDVNFGRRILRDTTSSITELGLGLQHDVCRGGSTISIRGGYEWQKWNNFSYGFEDTHGLDEIAAPADAGFRGFTFSIGITR